MKQFFKKHSKSFTIIELIIAVSIIIILSVVVIGNYEWGGYEVELHEATQKVVQDMSKLRNEALASSVDSPPPGIYIGLQTSSYIIFKDRNGNGEYDSDAGETQKVIDLGEDIYFESVEWDLESNGPKGPRGSVNLSFIPPEPTVKIVLGDEEKNAVMVTLWSRKSNSTSSIFISQSGLIETR